MIDEALEMDDEFARLLDEYHSAYLSGSTIGFWNQHTCSKELITRVEQAHEGLKQLDRYLSDSVTRPQNAVLDSNAFGNFIAQPTQLGRFKLIRELGRGGFGVVYLAEDPSLNRNVAIKIPRIETLVNDSLRQRFVQEAEIAASLDHLHILPVFEIDETQHGIYIVSLYCPGTNLSQWLICDCAFSGLIILIYFSCSPLIVASISSVATRPSLILVITVAEIFSGNSLLKFKVIFATLPGFQ